MSPEVGVDDCPVPGRAHRQQPVEAGPEDPEDEGAEEGEEVAGVAVTLQVRALLRLLPPDQRDKRDFVSGNLMISTLNRS